MIFLNGTSSAGKTTLARAIQDESDEPYLYWGHRYAVLDGAGEMGRCPRRALELRRVPLRPVGA
ncbi:hypothetical protein [Streptomyces sp. NPDC056255]|uniref:phosphotransferase-like protein n=1 Tax=Streptomyces sp. NPDC056255 TaxID=3345764 RepID=UPI0035D77267